MAKLVPATKTTRKRQSTAQGTVPVARTKNAKVTKPTAPAPKTHKTKGITTENIFGRHLPSARLRLPSTGNISALEQVVFLTETIRSRDPLNRLVQNGFDTVTLEFIINQHRNFPKYPMKSNSLGALLRNTMREWQADWTFSSQKSGVYQDKKPAPDNLTLSNMQLNCQDLSGKNGNGQGIIDNVPFEALAVDVTCLPDGEDALDLTRCVLWSLHNPELGLLYPRDFVWLTQQLGGPKPVQQANYDEEVFMRWREADRASKNSINNAKDDLDKSLDALKEANTPAEYWVAHNTHTAATATLAAANTARPPLVTLEGGQYVIHQHLVPRRPHSGPDLGTIAQYLAQWQHQAKVHLPFGTQLSSSHSAENNSGIELNPIMHGDSDALPDAHPRALGMDEVASPRDHHNLDPQHPTDVLSSRDLYQSLLTSTFGHTINDTSFGTSALSDFPLEESDFAMAAEFLRLSGW